MPAQPWAHPWRPGERACVVGASAPLSLCVGSRSRRACEVAAFDEPAKPWVVAIGIPFGILGQPDKMHVARLDGAVEPLERRVALVEPGVHERDRIWRKVLLASDVFQRAQHFPGFVRAAQLREDVAPQRDHLAVATRVRLGLIQSLERQLAVPQPLLYQRELEVANPERRTDSRRLFREPQP